MSNSNAAAKKRRAAPPVQGVMTSPLFQSPQMFRASMGIAQPANQPVPTRGMTPTPPMPTTSTQMQPPSGAGLTLPQVISLVDKRLVTLETFMSETQNKSSETPDQSTPMNSSAEMPSSEVLTEYNHRFELLAEEIANLKHIVLSLQSYTMEVNKMLVEERVRVFSDMVMESNAMSQSNSSPSLKIHQDSDNGSIEENDLGKYDEMIHNVTSENITIVPDKMAGDSTEIVGVSANEISELSVTAI